MRPDHRSDPVLQRRHDPAPIRVILRIGAEHQAHVQLQPDRIPPNLHVPLLQHVEQAHLNPRRQIRQFVDRENPPVAPGDQPIVHRRFIRQVSSLRMLHQVDLPDQIRDGDVRRRQLLVIPVFPVHPFHRRVVSLLRHDPPPRFRPRLQRIVVDLRAPQHRNPLVQQHRQHPQNPRFRLPAQPQKQQIVFGKNPVDDLRNHRIPISHQPRKKLLPSLQFADNVPPQLVLHRARLIPRFLQLPDRRSARMTHFADFSDNDQSDHRGALPESATLSNISILERPRRRRGVMSRPHRRLVVAI